MATDVRMTVDELEIIWKEAVVAYYEILTPHLRGTTEKRNINVVRKPVSGLRAEIRTCRILRRNVNYGVTKFRIICLITKISLQIL
jgi:hypothetical protein